MARLTQKQRERSATVKSGGEAKFPIPDASHARNAMARLNQAKPPLSPEQKKTVARAAQKKIGATPAIARVLGKKRGK